MKARLALGIDLDPIQPSAAQRNVDSEDVADSRLLVDFPPAFVKPPLRDAPIGIDYRLPASATGSGLDIEPWQRRMPFAYALELMLAAPESRLRFDDINDPGRNNLAEELGQAAVCLATGSKSELERRSIALSVPNAIQESTQDALLRGMRRACGALHRHDEPVLVWRPVAAALEWIERCRDKSLSLGNDRQSHGTLVHLHLGIEAWEATALELITFVGRDGRKWLVPGRLNPVPEDLLIGAPLSQLEESALGLRQNSGADPKERARLAWHACWLTPFLAYMGLPNRPDNGDGSWPTWLSNDAATSLGARLMTLIQSNAVQSSRSWYASTLRDSLATVDRRRWKQSLQNRRGNTCLGIVVTGPVASMPTATGQPLGLELATGLQIPDDRTLLECPRAPRLLAAGACRFAERRLRGEPTYLDTLPEVGTVVNLNGEPTWRKLLQEQDRWVPGGKTWRGTPRDMRFQIDRGQRELELVVHREGAATCRKVGIQFDAPTTSACPVQLSIEMEPGQGNPRVEVVPENPRLFRGRRLHLDWMLAADTGRSPDAELLAVPRAFPVLEPRVANRWLWYEKRIPDLLINGGLRAVVMDYLNAPHRWMRHAHGPRNLERLKRWFWFRSKPRYNEFGSAVSSDGRVAGSTEDQRLLDEFVLALVRRIRTSDQDHQRDLLRILGSTSTQCEEALTLLRNLLTRAHTLPRIHDRWPILYACGNCFRSPEDLDRLYCHWENTTYPDYVDADSLALPILYRESALEHVDTDRIEGWFVKLHGLLGTAPIGRRVSLPVSRSALAIAYVLRRRSFDNGFLAPGTALHTEVRRAVDNVRRKPCVGDTPAVVSALENLERIVDYIDRKGAGRLTGLIDLESNGDSGREGNDE